MERRTERRMERKMEKRMEKNMERRIERRIERRMERKMERRTERRMERTIAMVFVFHSHPPSKNASSFCLSASVWSALMAAVHQIESDLLSQNSASLLPPTFGGS